ncbi:bifunctional glycosyltransferase family 2/GtrA family protein [Oscillibacter sp.]|uniref:bifunctional glycosyltransferase family 2/GtrA family protein n=1 Tax=Oscillibacter sp. TaxID=1945593 RepID=UPI002D7F2C24|nr:bifunctional glycosyltransferase family 2/GtrA family protein [Oscillibacter sp.]
MENRREQGAGTGGPARLGVLIPAYEPGRGLSGLVRQLREAGLPVVVVNDGSSAAAEPVFQDLGSAVVLRHEKNRGKGRALKTGIAYLAARGFVGVVPPSGYGQHRRAHILGGAEALGLPPPHQGRLILGARDVSRMPPRSRTGNGLTRALFRLLYGIRLRDTQTGLRGIPLTERSLPGLLELPGEGYEYEMEMLAQSAALFPAGVEELEIQTIYSEDSDNASHFRPLRDGMRIYSVLFRRFPRFLLSSLLAFLVDYLAFNLLYYLVLGRSVPAAVLARVVSGTVNYNVNRHMVFGGAYHLGGYLKILIPILLANCGLMYLLVDCLGLPAFLIKPLVDGGLYAVSFVSQNRMAQGERRRRDVVSGRPRQC